MVTDKLSEASQHLLGGLSLSRHADLAVGASIVQHHHLLIHLIIEESDKLWMERLRHILS